MNVSVKPLIAIHLVDDGLRLLVLRELQIGIDHVVHRVQLLVEFLARLCRARRRDVGRDRFLPIADAREDVRRHVLRVRRGRRDLGVSLGRIEPFLGKGRRSRRDGSDSARRRDAAAGA